jgi:hypothetical protein
MRKHQAKTIAGLKFDQNNGEAADRATGHKEIPLSLELDPIMTWL